MAGDRFALLVASSQYSDATLTRLHAPVHDVAALGAVLEAPEIGDFRVTSLVDQPSAVVAQEIETFFDGRRRDDLLLLYFSGHGILDQGSRLYFATPDTRVERPRSTAIAAGFVNDLMSECASRRLVLILDCCNSGAFARGHKAGRTSVGIRERFEGRGRMVITASDALEYAFESDGKIEGDAVGSVFTEKLVEGLRTGEADRDRDGWVSLDELYDYAYEAVLDTSPKQRPGKWAFGVEGQLLVARSTLPPLEGADRPAPVTVPAKPSRTRRRRPFLYVGAIAAAVLAAVGLVFALDPGLRPGGSNSPSLTAENTAALAVYGAWTQKKLGSLPVEKVSESARGALAQMPVAPVTPIPAAPSDCFGSPGEANCYFHYPGLGIFLNFYVFRYAQGLRVSNVVCYTENPAKPKKGGIPACARIVRNS